MAKQFSIPEYYRSPVISSIKQLRQRTDQRKKDRTPSELDLGRVKFKIARHFGFCYGVENAIEIAYRALAENPTKRVFLLGEMIHNPQVNADLLKRGVKFLMSTAGEILIPFSELTAEDIVIVPAFGTTVELFNALSARGVNPYLYNATCPFVEKVWKRSEQLGSKGYTVVIHGKNTHEETRATFSHAQLSGPSLVIRDIDEARTLAQFITGAKSPEQFEQFFAGRHSQGFDPVTDLLRIGVVNQTTMLAGQTQEISNLLRGAMIERFGLAGIETHFADTRDTLCYATSENQEAVHALVESGGDIGIVVGGYNSSNTSHLVELCEEAFPTYYIKDASEILSLQRIRHLRLNSAPTQKEKSAEVQLTQISGARETALGEIIESENWWPNLSRPVEVVLTAGASCPDALVEQVVNRVAELLSVGDKISPALAELLVGAESGNIGENRAQAE